MENRKGVQFNFIDVDGSPVQGALISMTDTDNGSRMIANQVGTNSSYTPDRTYTGTSNSSGIVDFSSVADSILLSVHWHNNNDGNVIYDNFDSRGNNNDTSDLFTFNTISYLHGITTTTLEMKGTGTLVVEVVLVSDLAITNTNPIAVRSYTEIENSEKFYDRSVTYQIDNYTGENSLYLTRSGNSINLGALDLIIDKTASSPLSVSGTTITIKADRYTGDLTTTGTITLANGAEYVGTRTDTNGTVQVTQLTLNDLIANTEVRVYASGTTTELAGVESSATSFSTLIENNNSVDIVILNVNYEYQKVVNVDTSVNASLPISQRFDRGYRNP